MTATEHELAASEHGDAARAAYAGFDPDATPGLPCLLLGMHGGGACAGQRENPTSDARQRAALEVERANRHLAAARALRDAEDELCRGFGAREREEGPLDGRVSFTFQPLVRYPDPTTVLGVVVAFGPEVRDADGLQAAVACHRARLAHRGRGFQPHTCALDDPAVEALVVVAPQGVLLQLRSDDEPAARRALELVRDVHAPASAP